MFKNYCIFEIRKIQLSNCVEHWQTCLVLEMIWITIERDVQSKARRVLGTQSSKLFYLSGNHWET